MCNRSIIRDHISILTQNFKTYKQVMQKQNTKKLLIFFLYTWTFVSYLIQQLDFKAGEILNFFSELLKSYRYKTNNSTNTYGFEQVHEHEHCKMY